MDAHGERGKGYAPPGHMAFQNPGSLRAAGASVRSRNSGVSDAAVPNGRSHAEAGGSGREERGRMVMIDADAPLDDDRREKPRRPSARQGDALRDERLREDMVRLHGAELNHLGHGESGYLSDSRRLDAVQLGSAKERGVRGSSASRQEERSGSTGRTRMSSKVAASDYLPSRFQEPSSAAARAGTPERSSRAGTPDRSTRSGVLEGSARAPKRMTKLSAPIGGVEGSRPRPKAEASSQVRKAPPKLPEGLEAALHRYRSPDRSSRARIASPSVDVPPSLSGLEPSRFAGAEHVASPRAGPGGEPDGVPRRKSGERGLGEGPQEKVKRLVKKEKLGSERERPPRATKGSRPRELEPQRGAGDHGVDSDLGAPRSIRDEAEELERSRSDHGNEEHQGGSSTSSVSDTVSRGGASDVSERAKRTAMARAARAAVSGSGSRSSSVGNTEEIAGAAENGPSRSPEYGAPGLTGREAERQLIHQHSRSLESWEVAPKGIPMDASLASSMVSDDMSDPAGIRDADGVAPQDANGARRRRRTSTGSDGSMRLLRGKGYQPKATDEPGGELSRGPTGLSLEDHGSECVIDATRDSGDHVVGMDGGRSRGAAGPKGRSRVDSAVSPVGIGSPVGLGSPVGRMSSSPAGSSGSMGSRPGMAEVHMELWAEEDAEAGGAREKSVSGGRRSKGATRHAASPLKRGADPGPDRSASRPPRSLNSGQLAGAGEEAGSHRGASQQYGREDRWEGSQVAPERPLKGSHRSTSAGSLKKEREQGAGAVPQSRSDSHFSEGKERERAHGEGGSKRRGGRGREDPDSQMYKESQSAYRRSDTGDGGEVLEGEVLDDEDLGEAQLDEDELRLQELQAQLVRQQQELEEQQSLIRQKQQMVAQRLLRRQMDQQPLPSAGHHSAGPAGRGLRPGEVLPALGGDSQRGRTLQQQQRESSSVQRENSSVQRESSLDDDVLVLHSRRTYGDVQQEQRFREQQQIQIQERQGPHPSRQPRPAVPDLDDRPSSRSSSRSRAESTEGKPRPRPAHMSEAGPHSHLNVYSSEPHRVSSPRKGPSPGRGGGAKLIQVGGPGRSAAAEEKEKEKEKEAAAKQRPGLLGRAGASDAYSALSRLRKLKLSMGGASSGVLGKGFSSVTERYRVDMDKVLGSGQFGVIRVVENRATGKQLALKTISKKFLKTKADADDIRREVAILELLRGHPNVVELVETFEDEQEVNLVMELVKGGELFDRLKARGTYSEGNAAKLMVTLIDVLRHCNSIGVVHRDVKPENILLVSPDNDVDIKVIDFGVAAFMKPGVNLHEFVGSHYYMAPEVIEGDYSFPADIWSAGVVLYVLLSGVPPFWAKHEEGILQAILECRLRFRAKAWGAVSDEAKDLVKRMLRRDPYVRITPEEILVHPWITEHAPHAAELAKKIPHH